VSSSQRAAELRALAGELAGRPAGDVQDHHLLVADLGLDSLAIAELLVLLAESVPYAVLEKTLRDTDWEAVTIRSLSALLTVPT
jgi:acyl carrier protein